MFETAKALLECFYAGCWATGLEVLHSKVRGVIFFGARDISTIAIMWRHGMKLDAPIETAHEALLCTQGSFQNS